MERRVDVQAGQSAFLAPTLFPSWIQPADPAAHYQAGFALGERLGATQAAQAFQQQQLARELQKDEFERQSQMALMQLKVDEAARQHRANAAYQTMIARGIDPMEALKSVGPEMGIDPSRVMAMQEQRAERASQQAALNDYRQSQLQDRDLDRAERIREYEQRAKGEGTASTYTVPHPVTGRPIPVFQPGRGQPQMIEGKESLLHNLPKTTEVKLSGLSSELRSVNKEIETFMKNNVIPIGKEPPREYMVLINRQSRLQRSIGDIERRYGQPNVAAAAVDEVAPSTEPSAPAVESPPTAPGTEKVIVISPDGKKFRLPKSQLDEAQRQGYKLSL